MVWFVVWRGVVGWGEEEGWVGSIDGSIDAGLVDGCDLAGRPQYHITYHTACITHITIIKTLRAALGHPKRTCQQRERGHEECPQHG